MSMLDSELVELPDSEERDILKHISRISLRKISEKFGAMTVSA